MWSETVRAFLLSKRSSSRSAREQIAHIVRDLWKGQTPHPHPLKLRGTLGALGKKAGFGYGFMGSTSLRGRVPRLLKSGVLWKSNAILADHMLNKQRRPAPRAGLLCFLVFASCIFSTKRSWLTNPFNPNLGYPMLQLP